MKLVSQTIMSRSSQSANVNNFSFTKSMWKGFVLLRVELMVSFVLIGRLNTKDRLHSKGIIQQDQLVCCLCNKEVKSQEDLFFPCEYA